MCVFIWIYMYDIQYIFCLWYCVDLLKGKYDLLYLSGEYSHKKRQLIKLQPTNGDTMKMGPLGPLRVWGP